MNRKSFLLSVGLLIVMCVSIQAQDFDSKMNSANTALMNGNYEVALTESKNLIAGGEGDSLQQAMVYSYAGLASEGLGKTADAIKYYKKAIQLQVPRLDIYDKMISLTKQAKNNADYEFALLEKRKAFPDFQTSIVQSLAYLYVNTKQYDKLLAATNELTVWFPTNATFFNFQGIAYQNLGQVDQAVVSYKKALELDPAHAGANMGLGMILYKKGSKIFDKEKKAYESISKPSRVDYTNYRKSLEEAKSVYREALPYLLKAYQNKSYSSLKGVIFNIYTRLEEKEKAMQYK